MNIGRPGTPTPTNPPRGREGTPSHIREDRDDNDILFSNRGTDSSHYGASEWDKIVLRPSERQSHELVAPTGDTGFIHRSGKPASNTSTAASSVSYPDQPNSADRPAIDGKRRISYSKPHYGAVLSVVTLLGALSAAAAYISVEEDAAADRLITSIASKKRLATIDNNFIYGVTNHGGLKAE